MPGSMSILGVRGWVYQVHPWYTPWKVHPPYWNLVVVVATETGGRHSTGMLSCVQLIFLIQLKAVTRCLDDVVSGKFAFSCYDLVIADKLQHWTYLPPATKLGQGNVFTPVCHSVHGGVCHTHTPGETPPGQTAHPAQCMLGYAQQAGGTHPTGMQSCSFIN